MSEIPKVHLVDVSDGADAEALAAAARAAFDAAGLRAVVRGLCAVKGHFGERGGSGFVPPPVVRAVVELARAAGARPFLTDTSVLYGGSRSNAVDHAMLVHEHGFGIEAVGAPFVPVDGLVGAAEVEIEIGGVHNARVRIAADAVRAGSAIVMSHLTGHLGAGFGAAIKNLGMGFAARRGKLRQHSAMRPEVDVSACVACGDCVPNCPTGAISVRDRGRPRGRNGRVARIDRGACSGCGECLASCRQDAIRYDWGVESRRLQEEMAEHALGFMRRMAGRAGFLTFATCITKDCDCLGRQARPICADVGVLAAVDPVAVDQAAVDLIRERSGRTIESMSYPRLDGSRQLAHAERIGLGSRRYELVRVAPRRAR